MIRIGELRDAYKKKKERKKERHHAVLKNYGLHLVVLPIVPSTEEGIKRKPRTAKKKKETYNTGDSLVVTDPTTNLAVAGLSMGEQTGSRALQHLWSYVAEAATTKGYVRYMLSQERKALLLGFLLANIGGLLLQ